MTKPLPQTPVSSSLQVIFAELFEDISARLAVAASDIRTLPPPSMPPWAPLPALDNGSINLPPFPNVIARHKRTSHVMMGSRLRSKPTFPRELFEAIVTKVAWSMRVSLSDVVGRGRQFAVVDARHFSMWVLSQGYGLSQPLIGDLFEKDPSSVNHALKRVRRIASNDLQKNSWLHELLAVITTEFPPAPVTMKK